MRRICGAALVGIAGAVVGAAVVMSAGDAWAQAGVGRMRGGGNQEQQQTGRSNVPKQEEKRFPLGQAWIAVSMNGKAFTGTERPSLFIAENFRASGFGGCNTFSATAFPLRQQGIAMGPLAFTRRNCDGGVMASEKAYLTALRTAQKWDTKVGSLTISGPNGELRFERAL